MSLRLPEQADLAGAVQKFVAANYTADETKAAAKGVAEVAALRARMVQAVARNANDQDHQATLQAFLAYNRMLSCLVARFPFQSASRPLAPLPPPSGLLGKISAMAAGNKVRQVSFLSTWFDAFRHSNRVQEYDIAFERLSVLFDIAALYSRHATQVKGSAPSSGGSDASSSAASVSLKESCRLFQLSSGLFEHLSRSPEVVAGSLGNGASIDLDPKALSMLSTLMLAQAQACFFEAATATASPKLVAKLAMGTALLFRDAHARCEKNAKLMHVLSKPDCYQWHAHCLFQSLCYQAAAHYWHAKGCLSEDEYGLEIAHLERARWLLQQARAKEGTLLRNLLENRSRLESAIVARLAAANKDNETIYYSAVPKQVSDPESVQTVKPLPLDSLTAAGGPLAIDPAKDDPFVHLVSPYLRAQVDQLRAKAGELQAGLTKRVAEAEAKSKTSLEQLGLPASLDAMATEGGKAQGVPEDVWQKISEIQYKGGLAQLADLNTRIGSAVEDSQAAFAEISKQLTTEAAQDGAMRAQFAHRWNRRPSEQLTVHLHRDADSVRRFLRDADASNTKVRTELDSCAKRFELLALTREEIEAKLPRATAEQSAGSQESAAALRALLAQLDEHTQKKMAGLLKDFEAQLAKTDFLAQLLASQHQQGAGAQEAALSSAGAGGAAPDATPSDDATTALLQPFQQFSSAFDEASTAQAELLSQITQANTVFLSQRSSDDSTARRQAFLHEVNVAVASYNKLLANLNEGLQFYADLQRTRIAPLHQKVSDYTLARSMEAQLILEQLTRESSGFKEDKAGAPASSPGNPFAEQHGSSAAAHHGQAGASNPNLNFESSNLYSLASPPPSALSPPAAAPPGGVPPRPVQAQSPQQQVPPPVPSRPQIFGTPTAVQQASIQQHPPYQQQQQPQHQQSSYQQPPMNYAPQPVAQPVAQPYHPQQANAPYNNPYAQPPPQASAPKEPEWQCAACTFLNPLSAQACQMCATKR